MSTPSFAHAQSLSTFSHRAAAMIAAVVAFAVLVAVLALNAGTTQSTSLSPTGATPIHSITPAGANMAQGYGGLTYRRSFAGHR